jgi:two-component system sensor histidine kinase YesM
MGLTVRAYDIPLPISELLTQPLYFLFISILILIGAIFLSIILLNKKISLPISALVSDMKVLKEAPLNKRMNNSQIYEIDQLVNGFNTMLDEIESYTLEVFSTQEKLYETEIRNNETEIYALQSQMNPHFLFNTLQCIRAIAVYENVDSIAKITLSMSEMLRYSMHYQEEVSIRKELEIVKCFELICSIRFQGKFHFTHDIDPTILDYSIGRMTLQPIVENAVVHGVSKMEEGGVVRIIGRINDDKNIEIVVEDNGPEIEAERLKHIEAEIQLGFTDAQKMQKSHSFGLHNINRRLKLLYGEPFGISIVSTTDKTSVSMRVPTN